MTQAALLPPAAKLSLVEKKNLRDSWETKKVEVEKELSDLLGEKWTIEVDPLVIAPYVKANPDYTGRPGEVIAGYFEGAVSSLPWFVSSNGEQGKKDLNEIVPAHVLSLDVDAEGKFPYCGPVVRDGKLVILFNPERLWSNVSDALEADKLYKALNDATPADAALSVVSRAAIANDYDANVADLTKQVADMLQNPDIKFDGNFEDTFAKLKAAGSTPRSDWESTIGSTVFQYFEAVLGGLKQWKFDSDDMLQEAFNEVVKTIGFRITDSLEYGSYCEVVVDGETLWVQTTPEKWYSNLDNSCDKLIDVISDAA